MNKQPSLKERRPIPGAEKDKLKQVKSRTRLTVVSVILLVVLIGAVSVWAQSYNVSLVGGDNAEIACDGRGMQIQRTSRTSVNVICSGPEPTAEATTPPQPTSPPPNPTNPPPEPTTPPPSPTPPPPGDSVQPYATAPSCEEIGIAHDMTAYHGLWNYEAGCHYDHTHNQNPADTIFAEEIKNWEQPISYPWQTSHENMNKHAGYKYVYVENPECSVHKPGDNCIKYALIQLHAIGSTMGTKTRFHSFRVIALICDSAGNNCGTMQTGGWGDFGSLHCGYKTEHCPLETDPPVPDENFGLPPYRTSMRLDTLSHVLYSGKNVQYWSSGILPIQLPYFPDPHNQIFQYDWQTYDAWDVIDPLDLEAVHFVCADQPDCRFNHSTMRMYMMVFDMPKQLGIDRITFNGFTDLKGNIDSTCTASGPECVPLIIDNVPAGHATFSATLGNVDISEFDDYDIYFCGNVVCGPQDSGAIPAGWIKYPN
ncbi:MAG: hypothetical protein H6657_21730 [Ardenticatenaceae bacterium]|nr:hypothetical protein [Ardenticatenaceae bacterium]